MFSSTHCVLCRVHIQTFTENLLGPWCFENSSAGLPSAREVALYTALQRGELRRRSGRGGSPGLRCRREVGNGSSTAHSRVWMGHHGE